MGENTNSKNRALESVLSEKGLFPSTSAPWQQNIIDRLLSEITRQKNACCLDAACGIGNNTDTIVKYFNRVDAFDKSENAVNFAKQRHQKILENVTFTTGDLESIKYPDSSFDCVLCTEALEHVGRYDVAIREIFRVTKPGGYVILSFQNHLNLSSVIKFCFEKIYKRNWDAWGTHGHKEGYENYLTCFQVRELIKNSDFTVIKDFGADYINAWLSWVPFLYRNYKILDKYPLLAIGRLPLLKYLGMDYFLLLKKHD